VILIRFVDLKEENLEILCFDKGFFFLRYAQHALVFGIKGRCDFNKTVPPLLWTLKKYVS
jgi:hypothetical protein